jgi:uncharacterized membrane protein YoaK (UPF0700 family)
MIKPSDMFLGISLGLIAGYVDTAGFVALFGLFTAHVTGNFVLIGSELSTPSAWWWHACSTCAARAWATIRRGRCC